MSLVTLSGVVSVLFPGLQSVQNVIGHSQWYCLSAVPWIAERAECHWSLSVVLSQYCSLDCRVCRMSLVTLNGVVSVLSPGLQSVQNVIGHSLSGVVSVLSPGLQSMQNVIGHSQRCCLSAVPWISECAECHWSLSAVLSQCCPLDCRASRMSLVTLSGVVSVPVPWIAEHAECQWSLSVVLSQCCPLDCRACRMSVVALSGVVSVLFHGW